jgi:Protein of unknown function (DUF1648)
MRLINTIILVLASVGLLLLWAVFLAYYGRLPDTIPTHFGFTGAPNGWGAKSMLLLFPLLGLVAYGMAIVFHFVGHPLRRPMPAAVETLVFLLLAELVWLWFFLQWQTIQVALGRLPGLSNGVNVPFLLVLATVVAMIATAVATRAWKTQR